jgi:hypothetical protein
MVGRTVMVLVKLFVKDTWQVPSVFAKRLPVKDTLVPPLIVLEEMVASEGLLVVSK